MWGVHREGNSETRQEFPKHIGARLTACVSYIDHQNLVRDDGIEQRKGRTPDMVFPHAIEILEARTAFGIIDDGSLGRGNGGRHRGDVELRLAPIVTAQPSKTGFRRRQIAQPHDRQRAAGKSSSSQPVMHLRAIDSLDVPSINKTKSVTHELTGSQTLLDQIADGLICKIGGGSVVEARDLFQSPIETGIDFGGENDLVYWITAPNRTCELQLCNGARVLSKRPASAAMSEEPLAPQDTVCTYRQNNSARRSAPYAFLTPPSPSRVSPDAPPRSRSCACRRRRPAS